MVEEEEGERYRDYYAHCEDKGEEGVCESYVLECQDGGCFCGMTFTEIQG